MRLCIIVPMYNEEAVARESIEAIIGYVRQLPPVATVLAVNDGSRDSTGDILKELSGRYKESEFKVISHAQNKGYGAALKSGIKFAVQNDYDYALFMDSDMTNHPKYLKVFYEKMLEGWDYIKATRYAKGGRAIGVPLSHRIISFAGNSLARTLFGLPLSDLTNGFRAVKVDIFKKMDLIESGFVIVMEELYQAKFLTDSFCEIPYVLTTRKNTHGRTHFSYGLFACMRYLKYCLKSFIRGIRYEKVR